MPLRYVLVAAQLAFSTILIVGAGLLVRALERATAVDPGFDPRGVEAVTMELAQGRNANAVRSLARELASRASELPDVQGVGVASSAPLGDAIQRMPGLTIPGRVPPGGPPSWNALANAVDPGYF